MASVESEFKLARTEKEKLQAKKVDLEQKIMDLRLEKVDLMKAREEMEMRLQKEKEDVEERLRKEKEEVVRLKEQTHANYSAMGMVERELARLVAGGNDKGNEFMNGFEAQASATEESEEPEYSISVNGSDFELDSANKILAQLRELRETIDRMKQEKEELRVKNVFLEEELLRAREENESLNREMVGRMEKMEKELASMRTKMESREALEKEVVKAKEEKAQMEQEKELAQMQMLKYMALILFSLSFLFFFKVLLLSSH